MKFIRMIFFPFSVLYAWIMNYRNRQFDNGQRSQTKFDRTVISVGNLSTGGTGKTPTIEFLIRLLKDEFRLATISRGYGRKTSGFRQANSEDTAETIGDEPYQFFKKFENDITVSVCEERVLAIPSLLLDDDSLEVFLLDDAYQHRQVARDFNIMLSDFNHPFYEDFVLPAGNLRESRKGAQRADAIIITKCPKDLSESVKQSIIDRVRVYNAAAPLYFSHINYLPITSVIGDRKPNYAIALLTGIAKPKLILDFLSEDFNVKSHLEYADHYRFRERDIVNIGKKLNDLNLRTLVTTEKDMVRLLPFKDHSIFKNIDLFYLPIAFEIDRPKEFKEQLFQVVEKVN
ncbi:tetraacyldisaccharide 4'-kinase [Roseivirga misakiensis]|uniref:Tetraacyldisaccharide 4'-kinase n=1 Tax=Roseivirga misakiensis TaxID=1563681 RepID=A0A1E5T106_9BACT|nr:tetraacyldisaccharide 4'-kinase [Roseivirga misakiensis]OEK05060.1 tetraacyldisaccharide 4'-kinase [Roseivirga misakiensis]